MLVKSESITRLAGALLKAKQEFQPVIKSNTNPFFHSKYADLQTCIEATEPALAKNDLTISQFPVSDERGVGVLTLLIHSSGEYIGESYCLPVEKQDAQKGVAAITYARRAARLGILDLAAEDDDGNTAAGHTQRQESRPQTTKSVQKTETTIAPYEVINSNTSAVFTGQNQPATPASSNSRKPENVDLPNAEQLEANRQLIVKLQADLSGVGLKSSRNLPAHRKLLMFLLKTTGRAEVKEITNQQWNNIFQYVEKARTEDGGLEKLAKTINSIKMEEESVGQ